MASTPKKLTLKSSDNEIFEVEEAVAMEAQLITNMIEDVDCANNVIPLANVTGKILSKVIEYCKKHIESSEELESWDTDFVNVDQNTLFDLILAANYLNIKGLLDLTCETVANMMKEKKPEEIRKTFNIINDYTPEQEAEIRKEHAWAFD